MAKPNEHKTVQVRILKYANKIGWTINSQGEAESRRGFDTSAASPREKAKNASRFFTETLFAKVKEFNPKFKDSEGDFFRLLDLPLPTIYGNRDFLHNLQGEKTFFSREFNLYPPEQLHIFRQILALDFCAKNHEKRLDFNYCGTKSQW